MIAVPHYLLAPQPRLDLPEGSRLCDKNGTCGEVDIRIVLKAILSNVNASRSNATSNSNTSYCKACFHEKRSILVHALY